MSHMPQATDWLRLPTLLARNASRSAMINWGTYSVKHSVQVNINARHDEAITYNRFEISSTVKIRGIRIGYPDYNARPSPCNNRRSPVGSERGATNLLVKFHWQADKTQQPIETYSASHFGWLGRWLSIRRMLDVILNRGGTTVKVTLA